MRIVDGQARRVYAVNTPGAGAGLKEALARLQDADGDGAGPSVGLPIAAATLAEGGADLTATLASLPLHLRRRLVLEVKESLLMASSEAMHSTAKELQRLAVRIAIADFGISHVPLQAVFGLMPSYLKLGADYTRSLNQDNVDNLVDFLLSYCRYKGCTLVLQGVETATELQYWQRKGVETFQGAACT
jgi:EAL domain-containing protein (putative c-di-GMP-specific phosphodiesterase class I)